MRRWTTILWVCVAAALAGAVPGRAVVRAGLGGFYWSLDTPQSNTLRGVVAARPGADGDGLLAVGDASTFLIRRSPITDAASGWLAGRGRPVPVDTEYRGVARGPRSGLIAIAAADGSVLIGDGNTLASKKLSDTPLNAVGWFETGSPRLAILGDGGAAFMWDASSQTFTHAQVDDALPPTDIRRISVGPDSKTGYAAGRVVTGNGSFGVLLRTTDAGETWDWLSRAPAAEQYWDVSFLSDAHGFALATVNGAGAVFETTDGGSSWERLGTVDSSMRALAAFEDGRMVLAGGAGLVVSPGRGKFQPVPEPVSGLSAPIPLEDVDAAGPEAWAVGEGGVIFYSADAGDSWKPITRSGALDASQLKPWNAIQYLSDTKAVLAGDDGTIRRSTDGGRTFQTMPAGVANALFALAAPGQRNAGQGVDSPVPGIAAGAGRTILTYDAQKDGWATRGTIPVVDFFGAAMLAMQGGNRAWVVGANGVIVSSGGGDPLWRRQGSGTTDTLRDVDAVSDGSVLRMVAVGDDGTILISDDGANWQASIPFPSSSFHVNLRGVSFRDPLTGFVVGDSGVILRTLDGGKSWSWRDAPVQGTLYAVSAVPGASGEVYAVGEHQTVLRSTDNGTSWTRLAPPVPAPPGATVPDFAYRTVRAVGNGRVYIAGDAGHRLRTGDAGATWTETDGQSGASYTALYLAGLSSGVSVAIGGSGPGVAFTANAFKNVAPGLVPDAPALYAAAGAGTEIVLAGANGAILRATNPAYDAGAPFTDVAAEIRAAASPTPGFYVVAGGSEVLYSPDDGATWQRAVVNNPYGPAVRFRAIGFDEPDSKGDAVGYLAGGIPGQATPVLFRADDSGKTWDPVTLDFGNDNAGITALGVFSGNVVAAAENGAVYIREAGQWRAERPVAGFTGPWLAVSADDARWYVTGARGRAARYPDATGNLAWQTLNTGTDMDITAISGPPPPSGFGMAFAEADGPGGSGQSLRDDVRGVCMRPEGVLLSDTGGLALFGDLDQDTYINVADGVSSILSISGGKAPDDDGYFFGDIFPPVPGPDILPGDGLLDIRDATRVVRKTQGLD